MWTYFLPILANALLAAALWPQPTLIQTGHDVLWWKSDTVKAILYCDKSKVLLSEKHLEPLMVNAIGWIQGVLANVHLISENATSTGRLTTLNEASILRNAVHETFKSIGDSKFVPWKLHPRHSVFEPDTTIPHEYIDVLEIRLATCPRPEKLQPATFFNSDEAYELTIHNSSAVVTASSTLGALRGLQTFHQLFWRHSSSAESYTNLVPVTISDRPRWKHRGVSIDIARNPFHPGDLTRTIDAMARAKLSRLHVHATDSQSWPLDIPSLPDLARKGAYQPNLIWTAEDLAEIQSYGISKGISVFIEIDMPGHTASVAYAYPQLIAAFNELDWSTFAAEPLSGQLKLNSSAVTDFVAAVLNDLLPRNAPYTSLYHIGGDEVNLPAYLLDETVRSDDPQVLQPLLQVFIDHVVSLAIAHGFQPIVWEEMLLDWNLTLPLALDGDESTATLVQVWRNSHRIEEVLKRGHRAIFGDYGHWYLDCGFGVFLDPFPSGKSPSGIPYNTSGGVPSRLKEPYLDYCNPYHNWRHIYTYNPLQNISQDLHHLIEGGEVLMWSEQTDSFDLDTKLWPRAAAAAEVLWSGLRDQSMIEDASARLGEWRERAVTDLGVAMSPVQMTWCLMEGGCNL